MDGIVLSSILESKPDIDIVRMIESENKNSEIMTQVHKQMSGRFNRAFLVLTISGQLVAIGITAATIAVASPWIVFALSSTSLLIISFIQIFRLQESKKVHSILSKKYAKVKQFSSLVTTQSAKKCYEAINVLKGEIDQHNNISVSEKLKDKITAKVNRRRSASTAGMRSDFNFPSNSTSGTLNEFHEQPVDNFINPSNTPQ